MSKLTKRQIRDQAKIDDPFKEIAQGLASAEDIWEEEPVDIETFICDKKFLNLKWDGYVGCRPKVLEAAKELVKPEVREAVLLWGKGCLAGDTIIWTQRGPKQIRKLVNKSITVQSRNKKNEAVWNTGICLKRGTQATKRYTFSNGMFLDATANHQVNVPGKGIIPISEMQIGDYIAAPRKLKNPKQSSYRDKALYWLLGLMLGDGYFGKDRFAFTCAEETVLEKFKESVYKVDSQTYLAQSGAIEWSIRKTYSGIPGHKRENKIHLICEQLGLVGVYAKDKHVPNILMRGNKECIRALLSGLFSTDGWIEMNKNGKGLPYIFYCSRSKKLLIQIKLLLSRLGICATFHWTKKKFKLSCWKKPRWLWGGSIEVSGHEDCLKFFDNINCLRPNVQEAEERVRNYQGLSMKPNDQIPKIIEKRAGLKGKGKTGCARYRFLRDAPKRHQYQARIHWVQLKTVKDIGQKDVYDILCDNPDHNYCANGLYPENSGKDFLSSMLHLYGIYRCLCMYSPQTFYGLSPGSAIYFINVARNEQQAKNVFFKEFIGHLQNCAWFEDKYTEPGTQQVTFKKNVIALSGNSQAFGWLGYNTIQWVGDELAFFLEKDSDESSESKAEECWEAAFGSCQTRFKDFYKMIAITTPRFDDDFVMHKFYELQHRMKEDGTAYAMQAATWDMNPNITIDDFKNSLARDYRRTMRDFGAQPMGVIETFWGDPDFVDKNPCETCKNCPVYHNRELNEDPYACLDYEECRANPYKGNGKFRDWFSAEPDADYYIHIDLSKNKDKASISMTHVIDWIEVELDPFEAQELARKNKDDQKMTEEEKLEEDDRFEERPVIKVDFIAWVDPVAKRDPVLLKNSEIYYDGILKHIIYWLMDHGFNVSLLTTDSYQSHQFKQSLEDHGIQTELLSLDRTDEVPVQAKKCFVENRVEYPYDRTFAKEARHLKYIQGKRVDHPTGKGKDIIDSVFGSVFNCETEEAGKGMFLLFDTAHVED